MGEANVRKSAEANRERKEDRNRDERGRRIWRGDMAGRGKAGSQS